MSTTIPLPDRPNLEHLQESGAGASRSRSASSSPKRSCDVARGYGFASWPKLKKHVEIVTQYTRTPDLVAALDGSSRRVPAVRVPELRQHRPDDLAYATLRDGIATANVWAAAATGSYKALMVASKAKSTRVGGPFEWEPLMYLCYSRVEMSEMDAVVSAAAPAQRRRRPERRLSVARAIQRRSPR